MVPYRMDRTAFRINSFAEADNNTAYWLRQPVAERLRAAWYLTLQAYNLDPAELPTFDRTASALRYRRTGDSVFNPDFQDFFRAFNRARVNYLLVGGYAVIFHGYCRSTDDLNIWVEPSPENYQRLVTAFGYFGMPVFDMNEANFLDTNRHDVFSFGLPPSGIDVMTKVRGLEFGSAYRKSSLHEFEDLSIRVVQYQDLLRAKRAAGRNKDLNDIEQLEKGRE